MMLTAVCAAAVMLGSISANAQEEMLPPPPPPGHEMLPPPPPEFGPGHKGPRAHGPKFDREMHKKLADRFAKDLGLSEEQIAKADKIREDGRKKVEPLMKQMDELRRKADELRKENMKEFEAILTPEQKTRLEEMKARHDEMRKHRREDRKLRKDEAKADKNKLRHPDNPALQRRGFCLSSKPNMRRGLCLKYIWSAVIWGLARRRWQSDWQKGFRQCV